MIVFVDGLSGLGKSTLVNTLKQRNAGWISFKGAGATNIGMGKEWQEYNPAILLSAQLQTQRNRITHHQQPGL